MPKLVAGVPPTARGGERAPARKDARIATHTAAFAAAAESVSALITRLRKGRDLLATMDGTAAYRAEGEQLWRDIVLELYIALREAYARYAVIRALSDHEGDGEALAMWNRAMPDVDDLGKLGVKALFEHYRGRMEAPEWVTETESRLVAQVMWPPQPGEDVWDAGLAEMYEPPPF